ncbi:gas vesicle protein GvpJ [Haladaptatus halobius]|uniref:gas vesicle protein GvpJ n=1 Tax=Haladaptatus halobius TaxID=2884875 RepID=UPI0026E54340|nr:gas vesicle protein [Haladaptatus halobius]
MSDAKPTRSQSDLAEMLELLLDKGVVINADIVVTVGETELLGVQLRAAIASFETAAQYGLEFPEGTDMKRVEEAAGVEELPESEAVTVEASDEETEELEHDVDDLRELDALLTEALDEEGEDEDAQAEETEAEEEDEEKEEKAQEVTAENERD